MPVHDAMYTHAEAEKLRKVAEAHGDTETVDLLVAVQKKAVQASSLSADAALDMFRAIKHTRKNGSPAEVQAKAQEIFSGPFWVEIA